MISGVCVLWSSLSRGLPLQHTLNLLPSASGYPSPSCLLCILQTFAPQWVLRDSNRSELNKISPLTIGSVNGAGAIYFVRNHDAQPHDPPFSDEENTILQGKVVSVTSDRTQVCLLNLRNS